MGDYNSAFITIIEGMLTNYQHLMSDKRLNRFIFDVYSYKAWAIKTFLDNVYTCECVTNIDTMRILIFIHIDEYDKFIDENTSGLVERYCAALEAMKEVEIMSRAFI